jgi:predicted small lipoprotein YifL
VRVRHLAAIAALAVLGAACGGGGPRPLPPATGDDVRAIQREEQRIAEASAAVARGACDPDPSVPACEAAARICAIADGSSDADLDERCRRAQRSCEAARTCVPAEGA